MPQFPERLTRSELGPTYVNNRPVENPETDVGEEVINPLMDQVAGMNLIVPRAVLVAAWNSGSSQFDVFDQAEAWNPNLDQAHPALTRVATGRYEYLFAASYLNSKAVTIATSLPAVRAHCFGVPASETVPVPFRAMAWFDPTNPLRVRIAVLDNTNALVDKAFWLEVM